MANQTQMETLVQSLVEVAGGLAALIADKNATIKQLRDEEAEEDARDAEYLERLNKVTSNLQGLITPVPVPIPADPTTPTTLPTTTEEVLPEMPLAAL